MTKLQRTWYVIKNTNLFGRIDSKAEDKDEDYSHGRRDRSRIHDRMTLTHHLQPLLGDLPSVLLYTFQPTHSTPVPSISPIVRPPYATALAYGIPQLPLP